jgi:hypothetical protein
MKQMSITVSKSTGHIFTKRISAMLETYFHFNNKGAFADADWLWQERQRSNKSSPFCT